MSNRLTKIITRTGDEGYTSLGDKNRLPKNHPTIEMLGCLDELNSMIGLVLAHLSPDFNYRHFLQTIQQDLFNLGGELCPPYRTLFNESSTLALEEATEALNVTLPPLKEFILPGGNIASATCHVARTIARRAERQLVTLHVQTTVFPETLRYLNRLSDFLFVLARVVSRETLADEPMWQHTKVKKKSTLKNP